MVTRRWNESDEAKAGYVRDLFTALAKRYNAMTDVWTLGLHRLWKRQTMQLLALRPAGPWPGIAMPIITPPIRSAPGCRGTS